MKNIFLLDIVKKELVGKLLKVIVKSTPINETEKISVKAHSGVTNAQFKGDNPKFKKIVERTVTVGVDNQYGLKKIVDIKITCGGGWDDSDEFVLIFDDETEQQINISDEFTYIDENTYQI
jgi:hypothetical protein